MRIISGKFGGRLIHTPKGLPVRPTTDKMREALFNILNNHLEWEGLRVLELFCGTASVSLECISRGAAHVSCVDQNRRCVAAARTLFTSFEVQTARVYQMKASAYIRQSTDVFGFIFMDPPYTMHGQDKLIIEIMKNQLLEEEGVLVAEHSDHVNFQQLPGFSFSRTYGGSALSFFNVNL